MASPLLVVLRAQDDSVPPQGSWCDWKAVPNIRTLQGFPGSQQRLHFDPSQEVTLGFPQSFPEGRLLVGSPNSTEAPRSVCKIQDPILSVWGLSLFHSPEGHFGHKNAIF